jgi:hypothetical protein
MQNQTAIITKVSPRLWRATSLGAALDRLNAIPSLHRWQPPPGRDTRRAEAARYYHKPQGCRQYIASSALVITTDGTIRVSGDDPQRCARLLDQLAGEHAPAQLTLGLEGGAQW